MKIKEEEKTDGEYYIKLALIYNEKSLQKKGALNILKEGLDVIIDDNYHQEIKNLMKDIKQELQNLFTGEIYDKETNNLEDIQIDKMSIDILKNDNDKFNMNKFNNTNQDDQKAVL